MRIVVAFGIDAFTGEGLDEAMAGADVVAPAWEDEKVLKFFTTVTRNALEAGRPARSSRCRATP
jgi:hypothetical protein